MIATTFTLRFQDSSKQRAEQDYTLPRLMVERPPVITVDGPVGSGKGTICLLIAQRLGWGILDSGALYRLLALAAARGQVELNDTCALVDLVVTLDVEFLPGEPEEPVAVMLENEDVTEIIRQESCAKDASRLAVEPKVRFALLEFQRNFRTAPGLVADGRDMGTVVFPDAPLKIFLTASAQERANRRYKQLKAKGIGVTVASLLADINARDKRDRERTTAPLKPADDAIVVDTTGLDIASAMEHVMTLVSNRGFD